MMKFLLRLVLLASFVASASATAFAQGFSSDRQIDYLLGPGDVVRIQVFQNNDLTVEARVSESGVISYPLLGVIKIGGLSPTDAERLIARRLKEGSFLQNPQVTLNVLQFRSQQVSVLGHVRTPGRYALETTGMRLSEILSMAGGVTETGADQIVVMTRRSGQVERIEIDLVDMFASGDLTKDIPLTAGDVIYVNRSAIFYVYGQVNRPGMYTMERGMTVAQAIAKGGGLTLRGTDKGVRVHRRYGNRTVQVVEPKLDDPISPDDLIFVRESIF
ncbi:MAG: polysaccharide export protein EpsE [Burkholderiaceae bacterium]|jgi:polysaccharide export outer membrane protein|nr:polysaccharide export protein EpsE [Burkholderiaceae bacterium]MEB2318917.1 polysaccharide export protein EpsE [Pseudomonadota bacterium]